MQPTMVPTSSPTPLVCLGGSDKVEACSLMRGARRLELCQDDSTKWYCECDEIYGRLGQDPDPCNPGRSEPRRPPPVRSVPALSAPPPSPRPPPGAPEEEVVFV